ncbi:MAG: hypothetical protein RR400_00840, partial [Clostridia bacterium]
VSVYAALSQSAKLTNSITITESGKVEAGVVITGFQAAKQGTATTSVPVFDTATKGSTLDQAGAITVLTKTAAEATKEVVDVNKFVFAHDTGVNFYAYKIVITNSNKSDIEYNIALNATGGAGEYAAPAGVVISSSNADVNLATFAGYTKVKLTKSSVATIYIVFSTDKVLDELTAAAAATFDLNISLTGLTA